MVTILRPTVKRVREVLRYEPNSGLFTWRVATSNRVRVGDLAGCPTKHGYLRIMIDNRSCYCSHLAWVIMKGKWPKQEMDHKDLNPSNNRWTNLRPASSTQQKGNMALAKRNTSGYRGVQRIRNRFVANISIKDKNVFLGRYDTAEEAYKQYCKAAKQHFGEFARI